MDLLDPILTAKQIDQHFDTAPWNFVVSWIGALSAIWLMNLIPDRTGFSSACGLVRWAQRFSLASLSIALAMNGVYPVAVGFDPKITTLAMSSAISGFLLSSAAIRVLGEQPSAMGRTRNLMKT